MGVSSGRCISLRVYWIDVILMCQGRCDAVVVEDDDEGYVKHR